MSNQSGKRSQTDPNSGPNKNDKISNQSSEQAQHAGSTSHDRSVRSGLPGQASQPHIATQEKMADHIAGNSMESGTGMKSREGQTGENAMNTSSSKNRTSGND